MSFYRSPALTDSFITGTRRTDGAGFWQSVVVRGYSSSLLGCCGWRGPTDLITLSGSCRFCPSCGLNFLPPTQKEAPAQLFHTDSAGGAAIDFQINKSEGRWGGNGLNWAGGEGVRCWMYVFLACQMSKLNLHDGSHFSSSRSSLWWIHPVVHNCTVAKWISGDWIHPNASLCFENLSNYWQLPIALSALATSPSSPLQTTGYLTPWEREGGGVTSSNIKSKKECRSC